MYSIVFSTYLMEASFFCEVMSVDQIIKKNKWRTEEKAVGYSNKQPTARK